MDDKFILTSRFLDEPLSGLEHLSEPGWIEMNPRLTATNQQERMIEVYRPLRDLVANIIKNNQRPVSFAGDCCASLPVMAGLQQANLSPNLIWLDAHGDFNTWETSPSGFLGGMPLAMIVGRGDQTISRGIGLESFPESRVILSDGRDLDPLEQLALADSGIYHVKEFATLMNLPLPEGPLFIHFDTDLINPVEAPAMNYPAIGGPTKATIGSVFRRLARTGRICAVSISAWNPELDEDGSTEKMVIQLVQELLN